MVTSYSFSKKSSLDSERMLLKPDVFDSNSALAVPGFSSSSLKLKWMLREAETAAGQVAKKTWPTIEPKGLISLRDPTNPTQFWVNSIKVFGEENGTPFFCVNANGSPVRGREKANPINPMFRLHVAIYQARPDVNSIVQLVAQNGLAYSTFGVPLKMLNAESCLFFNDHAVQTEFIGLKPSPIEAGETARVLGTKRGLILSHAGLLTVGGNVGEAVSAFVMFEASCIQHMKAIRGEPLGKEISDGTATTTHDYMAQPDVLWTDFVGQVGRVSESFVKSETLLISLAVGAIAVALTFVFSVLAYAFYMFPWSTMFD